MQESIVVAVIYLLGKDQELPNLSRDLHRQFYIAADEGRIPLEVSTRNRDCPKVYEVISNLKRIDLLYTDGHPGHLHISEELAGQIGEQHFSSLPVRYQQAALDIARQIREANQAKPN
jgi:hypothetical protein